MGFTHAATTSLSLSPTNNDHSIVMLSSDSEDDLPSLSQRIGLSKTVGSSKEPINGKVTGAVAYL